MPNQIVLAWTVDTAGTILSPTQAQTALAAVSLYQNASADPVLGQFFGLSVASDVTAVVGSTARRTLTLNMLEQSAVLAAPPPFPCRPRTATPPVLPFPLRNPEPLFGTFVPVAGSTAVATSQTQQPSLSIGEQIQFRSQLGVFYTVAGVSATTVTLGGAFTGRTGNTEAIKDTVAPVALDRAAVYSSSDLDTNGVATVPAIAAGSGARTGELHYLDSTGAGPFEAELTFTGRRPSLITLDDPAGEDISTIVDFFLDDVGNFENSVGEITLVELSDDLPAIRADATPEQFYGEVTDVAQLLIERHLAYLPPSYFSLAQQGAAGTQLEGDFIVTTGSAWVPTTEDQSGVLSPTDIITFVAQPGVRYEVDTVGAPGLTLTEVYSGIDDNFTGDGEAANVGTKGNLGPSVIKKPTGASLVPGAAAPPTNAQLAGPLAQFMELQTAVPPPFPPLPPATVPTPTFLSGIFTRTIQLALAGVPVVSETITFV